MKEKARDRGTWVILSILIFSLGGASASITQQIADAAPGSTVYINPGTYEENVVVDKPITLVGRNNPIVTNPSGDIFNVTSSDVVITGFSITGAAGSGIRVANTSPSTWKFLYNNVFSNGVGVTDLSTSTADAKYCYWGDGGTNGFKGAPSPLAPNNGVLGSVAFAPWLTAPVINGHIGLVNGFPYHFDNPDARVKVEIHGSSATSGMIGSAAYLGAPFDSADLQALACRYVDAFVAGYEDGTARVTVSYYDSEINQVVESSLKLYLWNGLAWVEAQDLVRNLPLNKVTGSFPAPYLTGSPIALAGQDYGVTILPEENPSQPISSKPAFSTFKIESSAPILGVYYQIDGIDPAKWKAIQENINAKTWYWPSWSMTEEEWAALGQGTHTIYFRATRSGASPFGDGGEVRWQFFKATNVSVIRLISPNGGETLNRQPFAITWEMPAHENVYGVFLTYSRDGGASYPYEVANLLGPETSYAWRSPNIKSNQARIKVTVVYYDGTTYSDTSDADFGIVKGYSFTSWRPGSGFSSFRAWLKPPYSFKAG